LHQIRHPIQQSALFRLSSRKRLAHSILDVDLTFLECLARGPSNFNTFTVTTGGKERNIELPNSTLQTIHRKLFHLLGRIETPDYLHSGVPGRSYITNAKVHLGNVPLVSLDIKKFYPSISGATVFRFFSSALECSQDVAGLLTRLCTHRNRLPIGSCISQTLAFHASRPLFDALHQLAVEAQVRDSYYVDDLTWSGPNATPSFLWKAKQVVHRHGFEHHKGRYFPANQRRIVTGVMIDGVQTTIRPSQEFELWKSFQDLGDIPPNEQAKALDRLIGRAEAATQIDARFERWVSRLRRKRERAP
jgi:hypothetical protein